MCIKRAAAVQRRTYLRGFPAPVDRQKRSQVQIVLHSFSEDGRRNVHTGEIEVRPPGAPTSGDGADQTSKPVRAVFLGEGHVAKHLATTQERWRSLISGVATNLLIDRSFTSSKPGPWRRGNVREVASCRGYEYHRSAPAVRIRMC